MTTTKKPTAPDTPALAPAAAPAAAVVGPALLTTGDEPVKVTLSHHLAIGGKDYLPGAEIRVAPDYARRLRAQGFVART